MNGGVTDRLTVRKGGKALDECLDAIARGVINHPTLGIEHVSRGRDSQASFEPWPHTERSHNR